MKLLITPTSPFARKARVVILEKSLAVEEVAANPWEDDKQVTDVSPLRKIPVLLGADAADGGAVMDSRVICEFLDSQNDSPRLLPQDAAARLQCKTREAVADGAMDAFAAVLMAGRVAPEMQDDKWKTWLHNKTEGALDFFQKHYEKNPGSAADAPDMGDIAAACLLGFMDFRAAQWNWRAERDALAHWHTQISARKSFLQTVPKA